MIGKTGLRMFVSCMICIPGNNDNNDNLNTPGSRTASLDEQCGTNLRRELAWDLGKWFAEVVSFKPALKSLE